MIIIKSFVINGYAYPNDSNSIDKLISQKLADFGINGNDIVGVTSISPYAHGYISLLVLYKIEADVCPKCVYPLDKEKGELQFSYIFKCKNCGYTYSEPIKE